jgi:disulfide bond formation protein DsbB
MGLSVRNVYLAGCIGLIGVVVAFVYLRVQMLDRIPCPLCMFQFFCLALSAVFFILLAWFYPSDFVHFVTSKLILLINIVGIVLSVKHIFLLEESALNPMCFENHAELLKSFYPSDLWLTFKEAFAAGICQGGVDVLGINLAYWFLLCFVVSLGFILFQMRRVKKYGLLG